MVTMVPVSPAINMSLKGQVAYKHSLSGARRLFFDVTVYITDVIRSACSGIYYSRAF